MVAMETIGFQFVSVVNLGDSGYSFSFGSGLYGAVSDTCCVFVLGVVCSEDVRYSVYVVSKRYINFLGIPSYIQ